ncbi:CKLF-like MARVEL transmembrane domain-containing protein 4 [Lingula anatina]|uniref:CKLF-like MARVEL transmembrane domain-containing protein 4 n=1 Tax=Lingula anatina TaxID=7574 RepID=A0A1S3IZN6_LINAN|nr:CKLF-like MARVEL transmembrane domain-containing protein 4 [Lingula anatina]XP_013403661.1 CKLF-like MARVEL transmembrane domain-containing protein 4 [Lingula anatina]XP_013403662.1 CKLF-like MARVEL transmembrane domain-containing protein 4 [Lingula anatina]XP_013403663.1 CKLF-like MARVEL transmembrane domain-containing protein 4 [Lingula anatina]|eukprot:XP_013403660.1 CKLF-like MARVEL transmembrane domain-containing protein 4 [Lingula anatina]
MSTTQTTTTTIMPSEDPGYIRSVPGILKIVEIILCLVVFICVIIAPGYGGSGWVWFIAISAFITTLILLIFHVVGLISRLPGPWMLIEFIYYIVIAVFFLIAFIIAAVGCRYGYASIIATAIFCFASCAVFGVDTYFQFQAWRTSQTTTISTGPA